ARWPLFLCIMRIFLIVSALLLADNDFIMGFVRFCWNLSFGLIHKFSPAISKQFLGGHYSMTVNVRVTETGTPAESLDVVALYRTMVTARVTNDLLKTRKTQGRFPFYIGCAGHESMAAVVAALNNDDWLALYYRDLAAWFQRTGDLYGPLREAYSRTTGPMSAGRNMPSHYTHKHSRILPGFSEVAGLC